MATFDYEVNDLFQINTAIAESVTAFPNIGTANSAITVTQTIEAIRETPNITEVTVSQSIVTGGDIGKAATDTLTITQKITGVLVYAGRGSSSSGGSAFVDPAAAIVYGNLATNTTVSFVHGATTITLRVPDWGDRDKYEVVRIQEESRDKTLIIYQDPIWPTTEILTLTFKFLSQTTIDSLLDFLADTNGAKVDYHDHFGRHWQGYILTPEAPVHQVGRNNFSITLEFQGTIQ